VLKNAPSGMLLIHILQLLVSIPLTFFEGIGHRDFRTLYVVLKGKIDAIVGIPKMLKKRRKLQSRRLVNDSEIMGWFW